MDLRERKGVWWDAHSSCGKCGQKGGAGNSEKSFHGPVTSFEPLASTNYRRVTKGAGRLVTGRVYW